jgi:hypothetical protein
MSCDSDGGSLNHLWFNDNSLLFGGAGDMSCDSDGGSLNHLWFNDNSLLFGGVVFLNHLWFDDNSLSFGGNELLFFSIPSTSSSATASCRQMKKTHRRWLGFCFASD